MANKLHIFQVTRRVDELGRVALPLELRLRAEIEQNDAVDICLTAGSQELMIRKAQDTTPRCRMCGAEEELQLYYFDDGRYICKKCTKKVTDLALIMEESERM